MSGDDLAIALFFVGTGITLAVAGVSQAGWTHRLLILSLFAIAAMSLLVGTFWMQIKILSPNVELILKETSRNPFSWMLIVLSWLVWPLMGWYKRRSPIGNEQSKTNSEGEALVNNSASEEPLKKIDPPLRIFTEANVDKLINFYRERTSVQGDALMSPFIGKWMKVEGTVLNVERVDVRDDLECAIVVLSIDGRPKATAQFRGSHAEVASHLTINSICTIIGCIKGASRGFVSLGQCELV